MKISSRFTIALHVLLCIHKFSGGNKVTSDFIAGSVGVNPVIVRRILGRLKDAGMISVARGSGGALIMKDYGKITLLEIFNAVESVDGGLFGFHEAPNPNCPVGKNIHPVLDGYLDTAQEALEARLKSMTFADVASDFDIRDK